MGWLRTLLQLPDVHALGEPEREVVLIEEYIPGREVALEGVVTGGALQVLAVFDKPDPLEGPFFEETIYVTSPLLEIDNAELMERVAEAVTALGLTDGPIHAECRLNESGVFVLEVAARPIGGLCSKALRFTDSAGDDSSLEGLLLRHSAGSVGGTVPTGTARLRRLDDSHSSRGAVQTRDRSGRGTSNTEDR